jgi:ATP-dependent DNA helicase DinG
VKKTSNPAVSESSSPTLTPLEKILGPGGLLSSSWKGYEYRPGQVEMAESVASAFVNDDIVLIEAGTGTGKTLAYLVPALLNGKKTIVSTGTKNLQEQIFEKDIPFIRRFLGRGFKAACLKGRENYLCLYRYKAFLQEPMFEFPGEAVYLQALEEWALSTNTGDRAELTELPDEFATWSTLSASGDRCLGHNCPDFQDCFIQRARRIAAAADLVVVNHHLFMADLAIRESGYGEVIPNYEAVIFDETHQLEDVATQYFGMSASSYRLHELRRDADRLLRQTRRMNPLLDRILVSLKNRTDTLVQKFFRKEGEFDLTDDRNRAADGLHEYGLKIAADVDGLASALEAMDGNEEEIEALVRRARNLSRELSFILDSKDSGFVYWAVRRGNGLLLRASPLEVGPFLQDRLYAQGLTLVFTSATMTTDRSFDYFKDRLGLLPEIEGFIFDSPFDFSRQALLYVPHRLPPPQSRDFLSGLVSEIEKLLEISRGRAFVLFTSYRNMHYAAEHLSGRLSWPCLVQGQAPRSALIDQFRRETDSVLFATHSFWQGVDVPGESLSAVIIDKLPFTPPDRPLFKARLERIANEGRDPFMSYQVPEAIISLKQGLGRLIRSSSDRGLLAVLDTRITNSRYGRKFLRSLPASPLTRDLDEVRVFFEKQPVGRPAV